MTRRKVLLLIVLIMALGAVLSAFQYQDAYAFGGHVAYGPDDGYGGGDGNPDPVGSPQPTVVWFLQWMLFAVLFIVRVI